MEGHDVIPAAGGSGCGWRNGNQLWVGGGDTAHLKGITGIFVHSDISKYLYFSLRGEGDGGAAPLIDERLLQVYKPHVDWLSERPSSPQDPAEGVELIWQPCTLYIPLSSVMMFYIK